MTALTRSPSRCPPVHNLTTPPITATTVMLPDQRPPQVASPSPALAVCGADTPLHNLPPLAQPRPSASPNPPTDLARGPPPNPRPSSQPSPRRRLPPRNERPPKAMTMTINQRRSALSTPTTPLIARSSWHPSLLKFAVVMRCVASACALSLLTQLTPHPSFSIRCLAMR